METKGRLMEFWLIDAKICILCSVDDALEVRLYHQGQLVGLEPCQTPEEAHAISNRWRTCPPLWPPF